MSTVPSWMNGSRFFDTDSTNSIFTLLPIAATMSFAISTSKPSTSPLVGFLSPKPGWSNFTPTLIDPACWMRAIVVPAADVSEPLPLPLVVVAVLSSSLQDAAMSITVATSTNIFPKRFMVDAPLLTLRINE